MPRFSILIFVSLWIVAMVSYPGWNAFDSDSVGHDLLRNFLCDLLSAVTPDGRSNRLGCLAMNTAVVALVTTSLLPIWWRASTGRMQTAGRVLAVAATVLTLTICAEQALGLDLSHNVITLAAGAAGLLPTMLAAASDWRSPDHPALRRSLLIALFASCWLLVTVPNAFSLAAALPYLGLIAMAVLEWPSRAFGWHIRGTGIAFSFLLANTAFLVGITRATLGSRIHAYKNA